MKQNCSTCANNIGDYCTRMMDMGLAQYKKCEGYKDKADVIKTVSKIQKPEEDKSQRELRMLQKLNLGSQFEKFLEKGGHWSARTGEFIGVTE